MAKCWTTFQLFGFCRSRPKAPLIDSKGADARLKRRARNPESLGRPSWPEHSAAARLQRLLDDRLLMRSQRARQRTRTRRVPTRREPTRIHEEVFGVAYDHRALDYVLKLTDVSGPRIRLQSIESAPVDAPERLARLARIAMDEVLHQQRDVLLPFPQRRHFKGKTARR